MNLTEAKLKQMILEALKNSSPRSFGIPTPDEKLRSDLGGEMFDKIQGADPEQSEILKQSFDLNYPRNIKQESLDPILEEAGFKIYDISKYTSAPTMHDRYNSRSWFKGTPFSVGSVELKVTYNIYETTFRYSVETTTKNRSSKQTQNIASGTFEIPPMFELSLKTDQGLRDADSIMLSKEKQAIEKALEQHK